MHPASNGSSPSTSQFSYTVKHNLVSRPCHRKTFHWQVVSHADGSTENEKSKPTTYPAYTPLGISHNRSDVSYDPEAIKVPHGDMATAVTACVWPRKVFRSSPMVDRKWIRLSKRCNRLHCCWDSSRGSSCNVRIRKIN